MVDVQGREVRGGLGGAAAAGGGMGLREGELKVVSYGSLACMGLSGLITVSWLLSKELLCRDVEGRRVVLISLGSGLMAMWYRSLEQCKQHTSDYCRIHSSNQMNTVHRRAGEARRSRVGSLERK